jgi:opacity protein-like surface antigen
MKSVLYTAVAAACILAGSVSAQEQAEAAPRQGYAWISGGSSNGSGSVAAGLRSGRFGIEAGALLSGDYATDDVLDYPVPHSGYVVLGEKQIGSAAGVDALLFLDAGKKVSFYGGLGLYGAEQAVVARSTATGWLYKQSSETKLEAAGSAGVHVHLTPKVTLGAGYHSVRGAQATLAFAF